MDFLKRLGVTRNPPGAPCGYWWMQLHWSVFRRIHFTVTWGSIGFDCSLKLGKVDGMLLDLHLWMREVNHIHIDLTRPTRKPQWYESAIYGRQRRTITSSWKFKLDKFSLRR